MLCTIIVLLTVAACTGVGWGQSQGLRDVNVDSSRPVGILKPLRGVNGAPDESFVLPESLEALKRFRPVIVSEAYRDAAINLVRTHDSMAGGIDAVDNVIPPILSRTNDYVIFPKLSADPSDPASYNFGPTDKLIGGIEALPAEVIFRLGRPASLTAEPPKDLSKYGEVIRHIVLHYNEGWDKGFHYHIRYWEIWNEPDLGRIYWRGSPEQYYELYLAAAKAIKAADPSAWVGGPTVANAVDKSSPYLEGFLRFVRAHDAPLDFLSWHCYSTGDADPLDTSRIGRNVRQLLDSEGFTHTQSVLDEWNYSSSDFGATAHKAAFVASSLIYMQDAPIDQEAIYRADIYFGADGKSPDKVGQALIALGRMSSTPVRIWATGADTDGFAVEAGRSNDGRILQVLISNYQIPAQYIGPRKGPDVVHLPPPYSVDLPLLPRRTVTYSNNAGYQLSLRVDASGVYDIERYRISDTRDFGLFDQARQGGPIITISGQLPPPGVDLIVLSRR